MNNPIYQPIGLANLGNTCFMNATLQSLLSVREFGAGALAPFVQSYRQGEAKPSLARATVIPVHPEYNNFRQHDAHEWMHALFDVLGDSQLKMFTGEFHVRVSFPCGHHNDHVEPFTSLSLPMAPTIPQALKELLQSAQVHSTCDTCHQYQRAIKSMRISKVPDYLIVHWKRFYNNGIKIETRVPTALAAYTLSACINHRGSHFGGHYTSCCRYGNNVFMCDDTRVFRIQEHHFLKAAEKAYMLIYNTSNVSQRVK